MRFALLMIALLAAQTGFAMGSHKSVANCVRSKNDPYDPIKKIPSGKYEDQCIDTSVKRPAIITSEDNTSITLRTSGIWISFGSRRFPNPGYSK